VVDAGFKRLAETIAANELPANTVSVDFTGLGVESTTQHGVAVAEEVVDMAPGVQLYCLKVGDEADLGTRQHTCTQMAFGSRICRWLSSARATTTTPDLSTP
jgi:hypothetical protein